MRDHLINRAVTFAGIRPGSAELFLRGFGRRFKLLRPANGHLGDLVERVVKCLADHVRLPERNERRAKQQKIQDGRQFDVLPHAELERGAERFFGVHFDDIDAVNFVKQQVREKTERKPRPFEHARGQIAGGGQEENLAAQDTKRNGVDQPAVFGEGLDQAADAELDRDERRRANDRNHLGGDARHRTDAENDQHCGDTGRNRHAVVKRAAGFDVDVGQHAAHATQTAGQQTGRRRKTARIPGQRAENKPAERTECRVLLVIGHWGKEVKGGKEMRYYQF